MVCLVICVSCHISSVAYLSHTYFLLDLLLGLLFFLKSVVNGVFSFTEISTNCCFYIGKILVFFPFISLNSPVGNSFQLDHMHIMIT